MWSNSQETANLVTFTEEILNRKLHFLCSAGITWKEILCCIHGTAFIWRIVENAKLCWSYATYFWILSRIRKTEAWYIYANKFSWNAKFCFLTGTIHRGLCTSYFFRTFLKKKKKIFLQNEEWKEMKYFDLAAFLIMIKQVSLSTVI